MTFVFILPTVLSALVTAAHFLKPGNLIFVGVSLLMPFLLLIRRRWALLMVQLALLAAAGEWLWSMLGYVEDRASRGEPALRLVIILSSVAAFCILSAVLLQLSPIRKRYR